MDTLDPLLKALQQVRKGKCTAKELIAPLETAIKLSGNAAAHLSMERRRALMRHLNSDLKSLAEGDFPNRGPLLFGKDFASKAKSTADNVKALKGFIPRKASNGFSGSGDQNKRKLFQPAASYGYAVLTATNMHIKDMWKEPKSSDIQSKNGQGLLEAEYYLGLYEEDGGD